MSTMRPPRGPPDPVAAALFPAARRAVLSLLYGRPDERFYVRQIVTETGLGVGHVQREVARLVVGGILRRTREGRHVWLQAEAGCPVFRELRGIVTKTLGVGGLLRRALAPLADRIATAFVFGSVARGEEGRGSDVDLMVVGEVSLAEVVRLVRPVEAEVGRDVNAAVYAPAEVRAQAGAAAHFLGTVLRAPKVFVLGDEHELGRLLPQRLAPSPRTHGGRDPKAPRDRRS